MNACKDNLIRRSVAYLNHHPTLNLALVSMFAPAIILCHDLFVKLSIFVMNALTLPVYNTVIAILACIIGLLTFIAISIKLFRESLHWSKQGILFIVLSLLLILHALFLLEMNIELIHVAQYAVLALLLYPLFKKFGLVLAVSLPLMIIDEWYQYIVLYPYYIHYFEFNDIVLDLLGQWWILSILWIFGLQFKSDPRPLFKRIEAWILLSLSILFAAGIYSGYFALYPDTASDTSIFIFNQLQDPSQFWQIHDFTGAKYHVMLPWEGVAAILAIILSAVFADKKTGSLS